MNTEVIISIVAVVIILAVIAFFMMHKKDNYTVPTLNSPEFYDWINTDSATNWLYGQFADYMSINPMTGKPSGWFTTTPGSIWFNSPVGKSRMQIVFNDVFVQ